MRYNRGEMRGVSTEAEARRLLGGRCFETLRLLAAAIIPSGGAFPLGAEDAEVAVRVAAVAEMGRAARLGLRAALAVWEAGPLLSPYRRRFSRLPPDDRLAYTERAATSRLPWRSGVVSMVKALCLTSFASHPSVTGALGFPGRCLDEAAPDEGPRLSPLAYPDIRGNVAVKADVCVVGSGAGGAVMAAELAERGLSVVIVEEGGYFTRDDFEGPLYDRVRLMYRDGGLTAALGPAPLPIPLGMAVGGTTVVNSGTCLRTSDRVLRDWRSRWGIEGIDPQSMAPVFERIERALGVRPVPEHLLGNNARVFRRGADALGYHGEPIRRAIKNCRGCGVCTFGCPSDAKQAMHLSYLPRAEAAGAVIYSRCRVRRILQSDGRASGVEAEILGGRNSVEGGSLRVRAEIVVLAAGAIHTPLLLMASGLAERRGPVGRHLRIHPAISVSALFDEDVYAWKGTLQSFVVDQFQESHGLLFEVTSLLPGLTTSLLPGVGRSAKDMIANYHRMASTGLFAADSSEGRVMRLPGGRPLMTYRLNREDAAKLAFGAAVAGKVFFAAGARTVYTGLPDFREVTVPTDLDEIPRRRWGAGSFMVVGFHPMGTARMGRDPEACAVRPSGEAYALPGLFVADASILPSCVGVNPQITIMAMATRIAGEIARQLGGER